MIRLKIIIPLIIIASGFLIPADRIIPVKGAGINDINRNSFWSYPWGKSVTHKGIDIFAKEGTVLFSSAKRKKPVTAAAIASAASSGFGMQSRFRMRWTIFCTCSFGAVP